MVAVAMVYYCALKSSNDYKKEYSLKILNSRISLVPSPRDKRFYFELNILYSRISLVRSPWD